MENKNQELNRFEKMAELYNAQRLNKQGQKFTSVESMKLIKFIPCIRNHMSVILKHKLLVKNLDGTFSFPKEPAFWNVIKNCSEECRAIQREYTKKYKMNKKQVNKVKPLLVPEDSIKEILENNGFTLEDVAKYLVSTGNYQVLKKHVEWVEI